MHILTTGVRGTNSAGGRTCMPTVNGSIELHPRVGALPSRLSNLTEYITRFDGLEAFAIGHSLKLPIFVIFHGAHKVICYANRVISVLILHRVAILAVQIHIVASLGQHSLLTFFNGFTPDKIFHVRVVSIHNDHLGCSTSLTAAFNGAGRG